ncbi:fibroblast growth factor 2 [Meleagris gallopavo]|uniref:fibroblast growth factor 2 n=1 Tax=Meleagris gallopavo TaxID=9103 RepID=UPI000549ADFD|nr:fibroblast growth factor 2 [Meleagris gallopavo]
MSALWNAKTSVAVWAGIGPGLLCCLGIRKALPASQAQVWVCCCWVLQKQPLCRTGVCGAVCLTPGRCGTVKDVHIGVRYSGGAAREPLQLPCVAFGVYCKNGGFFLRINPDGRVDGVREKSDPHIKLQLQAEERGVVSIKGVSANRFLAMKEDGRLLALKCATEECFFFERLESNNYNTYRSRKYSDWYVALKRTGQYKPGPKTGPGQKAILFLPMSAKS